MSTIKVNALRHTGGSSDNINLDSSARVLIGTSTSQGKWNNSSGDDHLVQIESTSAFSQSWISHSTSATAGVQLDLGRSRGTSSGSTTVVNSGDLLGHLCFQGADGSEFVRAALIQAYVDGTPGANDMPGRLVFSTTADGASSPTEAMRIDSSQNLRFNSGYGSVATAYGVRAWVNFQGKSTVTIREDGNVSSVTDDGTGSYTVNLATSLVDDNYAVAQFCRADSGGGMRVCVGRGSTGFATGSIEVEVRNGSNTLEDVDEVCLAFFR